MNKPKSLKMKNLILIFFITILISCNSTKKHIGDKILETTKLKYGALKEIKLGDGSILYSFSYVGADFYEKKNEIKNSIDKLLNILPSISIEDQYDHLCNCSKNFYSWETPEIKIDLIIKNSFEANKDSIHVRYCIIKK